MATQRFGSKPGTFSLLASAALTGNAHADVETQTA